MAIMSLIEAKSDDRNKYLSVKCTESCRLVRGAREADREYLLELCTERSVIRRK